MNKLDRELDFLDKFDSGYKFNEEELASLTWETDVVDEIERKPSGWFSYIQTVFRIRNRGFAIDWDKSCAANIEGQESNFYEQPVEVELHKEVITKTTWLPIGK